ncbi:MAG: hypothetical protein SF052_23045 [Bacteroidia bacterium]|nr:hypothetical protein [Bacteroidia bacterium]
MRLLAIILVALLSVQTHLGQGSEGRAEPAKLRRLNNYKLWGESENERVKTETEETPVYTPSSPKLKIKPNKRALYSPRKKKEKLSEEETYRRIRAGRNGRIRPEK